MFRIFYYADEKYNISERELDDSEIRRISRELMPFIVEDEIRELMAKKLGLEESIVKEKDFDVDVCLLKFKKPEVVVEVKWKENILKKDVDKAVMSLERINAKKKYLFVPDKRQVKTDKIEVIDITDLL